MITLRKPDVYIGGGIDETHPNSNTDVRILQHSRPNDVCVNCGGILGAISGAADKPTLEEFGDGCGGSLVSL